MSFFSHQQVLPLSLNRLNTTNQIFLTSIDGEYLMIGRADRKPGHVSIWKRDNTIHQYREIKKIMSPQPQIGGFGWALFGTRDLDYVFVSHRSAKYQKMKNCGLVYVYRKATGDNWVLHQTISPYPIQKNLFFGSALTGSFDASRLVISSGPKVKAVHRRMIKNPINWDLVKGKKQLWIYDKSSSDSIWDLSQTIRSPNSNPTFDSFGVDFSISTNGNYLAVGSPKAKLGRKQYGCVNLYRYETETEEFRLVQSLPDQSSSSSGYFGRRVKISANGETLYVAGYLKKNRGSLQFFRKSDSQWKHSETLTEPFKAREKQNYFAYSIDSTQEGSSLIFSRLHDTNKATGAIYHYHRNPNGLVRQEKLIPDPSLLKVKKNSRLGYRVYFGANGKLVISSLTTGHLILFWTLSFKDLPRMMNQNHGYYRIPPRINYYTNSNLYFRGQNTLLEIYSLMCLEHNLIVRGDASRIYVGKGGLLHLDDDSRVVLKGKDQLLDFDGKVYFDTDLNSSLVARGENNRIILGVGCFADKSAIAMLKLLSPLDHCELEGLSLKDPPIQITEFRAGTLTIMDGSEVVLGPETDLFGS